MRHRQFPLLLITLYVLLVTSECANPISPSGGPKDTIPPTLLQAEPPTGTILYSGRTLRLTFDEFINADKLRQSLIITPQTDTRYTSTIKKNRITITFDEDFQDSITYTFNFFNSITDITERTPATNLILAFSTGPYIDSLKVSGNVVDLLTQQSQESIIAALYPYSDSLDFTQHKPMYFASTQEDGTFTLSYIKAGTYKLLAFEDSNNNLLLESQTEAHAFIPDSLRLSADIDSLTLQTILLDIRLPYLVSARPFGAFFQLRYNKPIIAYDYITPTDTTIKLNSRLTDDKESIQFYPHPSVTDSLLLIVNATDTTNTTITDTTYLQYTNSQLRAEDFVVTLQQKTNTSIRDTIRLQFTFNKPLLTLQTNKILIQADTLYSLNPPTIIRNWNNDKTQLNLHIPWSWNHFADTLTSIIKTVRDSASINPTYLQQFQLTLDTAAFISITNDSSLLINRTFQQFIPAESGIITYELNQPPAPITVQLIDDKYKVIQTKENQPSGTFANVPPGTYGLRILIDSNNDGKWSYGNINTDEPPEPVIIFDNFTELRANWEVNIPPISLNNL